MVLRVFSLFVYCVFWYSWLLFCFCFGTLLVDISCFWFLLFGCLICLLLFVVRIGYLVGVAVFYCLFVFVFMVVGFVVCCFGLICCFSWCRYLFGYMLWCYVFVCVLVCVAASFAFRTLYWFVGWLLMLRWICWLL